MNTNDSQRLHALDAVRGFALLLGVAFHAAMSFLPGIPPGIWSTVDNSPSPFLADAGFVAHCFRMSLFFFIAGFFARLLITSSARAASGAIAACASPYRWSPAGWCSRR
jgi:peptidoglycan/LPS O-acetylase OafA/YrhL